MAEGRDLAPAARAWLDEARRITHDIPRVGAALLHAEQGRRLNVRAVGTPDVGPGLRQGLEALEHSAVAIRGMFRALVDATYDATWPDDEAAEDVLLGLAQTFREMAAGVDAFGQLVRDEADPANAAEPRRRRRPAGRARGTARGAGPARRPAPDRRVDADPALLELHAAVLSTVKRLLREMDLDERIRRQVRLLRADPATAARRGQTGAGAHPGRGDPAAAPAAPRAPRPALTEAGLSGPRTCTRRRGCPRCRPARRTTGAFVSSTTVPPAATAAAMRSSATSCGTHTSRWKRCRGRRVRVGVLEPEQRHPAGRVDHVVPVHRVGAAGEQGRPEGAGGGEVGGVQRELHQGDGARLGVDPPLAGDLADPAGEVDVALGDPETSWLSSLTSTNG